ncbi:hypothetical protein BHM03_00048098 [Ensete ventricosum]|nr:hypothetical protein BHM03_00048098 [Ensete ventricosum]
MAACPRAGGRGDASTPRGKTRCRLVPELEDEFQRENEALSRPRAGRLGSALVLAREDEAAPRPPAQEDEAPPCPPAQEDEAPPLNIPFGGAQHAENGGPLSYLSGQQSMDHRKTT